MRQGDGWERFDVLLLDTARSVNEILTGISRFRTASMRCRQEDRLLNGITDLYAGLGHLERLQTNTPTPTAPSSEAPPAAPP
ncbi:hypothetical protein [Streptomyces sp. NPDC046909]|uniref:hypothetical protein n=1 Tax=Streptomyces sp. NPDC046909 TaxID=3155617 RepID=UPI0033DD15FC